MVATLTVGVPTDRPRGRWFTEQVGDLVALRSGPRGDVGKLFFNDEIVTSRIITHWTDRCLYPERLRFHLMWTITPRNKHPVKPSACSRISGTAH